MKRRITTLFVLASSAALALLPPLVSLAQPQPQPQVTQVPTVGDISITLQGLEARLMPIAIPSLRGLSGDGIAGVISNDLRLSASFLAQDEKQPLQNDGERDDRGKKDRPHDRAAFGEEFKHGKGREDWC